MRAARGTAAALCLAALVVVIVAFAQAAWGMEPCCRPVGGGRSANRCAPYRGEQFIICAEAWGSRGFHDFGMRHYPNSGHTASGPYGLTRSTQRAYGGDTREAAHAYMTARYGSWDAAERFHRRRNFW